MFYAVAILMTLEGEYYRLLPLQSASCGGVAILMTLEGEYYLFCFPELGYCVESQSS